MLSKLQNRIDTIRGVNPIETDLAPYLAIVEQVSDLDTKFRSLPASSLRQAFDKIREIAIDGSSTKDLLPEVFALVRRAAQRTLGMRPFDVQVLAGIVLYHGKLAELATGEGKTLAAVMPAVLRALSGKGVHVLTFNDYLARRDAQWMGPIYETLGISVGYVQEGMNVVDRRASYSCDVTYATAKEVGFDLLRTHLARTKKDVVLRPFHAAIVDEADSILIDESRTPLVIAGDRLASDFSPNHIGSVVESLTPSVHWETDENRRNVFLTAEGLRIVEQTFGDINIHEDQHYNLLTEVNQALHARALLQRDVDYIVREGSIELVDEFTGRVVDDRRWPDGLQTAIEAKENVGISPGGRILGQITMQHFLQHYKVLAGMTATAQSSAEELVEFYGLKVVPVPPNVPCIREDLPDAIYTHTQAKFSAIVDEIKRVHASSRPILVGTRSVAESEELAKLLKASALSCQILNAKNDDLEAITIADAGMPGAITISTNMAGRGTDIKLGGASEEIGRAHV